ncbi:GNAT family N-acetyltransferase [Paucibacter sediminis]|uniref:GNAT family N-acetyltransferase n=1 Tax=Paucibacter sediminis TaxID=3019553 RepID=A0AA95NCS7_9BURK|nr:GNAT family N-acetyltransferase [Paucibacter sp. S2-9]WIT11323.1 GNAT family N-acetyltransferase [Paucibacter sp. S2-9]
MAEAFDGSALRLRWSEAPWDEAVLGYTVFLLEQIDLCGEAALAAKEFEAFERARALRGVGLVSCRLPHQSLRESMLLEDRGFRFIEMVYRPSRMLRADEHWDHGLQIERAGARDLPLLQSIAATAFRNERFCMDPRLDSSASDRRYANWVASAFDHPQQQLYVLRDGSLVVAFFVLEWQADGACYWHLNAIAPQAQGQGYGRRAWSAMMGLAAENGCVRVHSSVVARNHRVINLYARLGFSFSEPTMTFHWVRGGRAP